MVSFKTGVAVAVFETVAAGVNRCLPLAVCNGVTELHGNLRKVLELLDLGRVQYFLAGDLKLINSMLGLSGIGSLCIWLGT